MEAERATLMRTKECKRTAVIAALLALILALPCVAHSGRTDSHGGHYDHSTGDYHYHHGKPAHYHYADGSCPYVIKAQEEAKRLEEERLKREEEERKRKEVAKNVAVCGVGAAAAGGTIGIAVKAAKKRKK